MASDLVARDDALGALRNALTRAGDGHGGVVVVRGEPGIGKSTLALAFAAEAEKEGVAATIGRTWELGEAPPYFPLRPCMRAIGVTAFDPDDAFGTWDRVLEALVAKARERTVVWIVEDVHAADLHTLDLLTFLARPLAALRMLVVVTTRDKDARISERAALRLHRLARDGVVIELSPLGPRDVAALASRVAGHALAPRAAAELHALTAGNPLFVVECARAFRTARAAPRAVSTLPHTVREAVAERVQLLPEATRRAIDAFAVLGRETVATTLAATLGVMPATAIDALAPAIAAGVVVERRPGHFAFSHIIVRDAIEDAIAPADRAALHAVSASALQHAGDSVDVLAERARHALASMARDGEGVALAWRAAEMLAQTGAFDRAYSVLVRVDEARALGGAPPATHDETLRFASIAQAAGRHAEARAACVRVLDEARATGNATLLARAALVLGAEIRPAMVDDALVSALDEASRALGDRDPALTCRVLARLAAARQPAPNPMEPIALARDAIARTRKLGDEALLLDVLHTAGAAFVDYAPIHERIALNEEVLVRATAAKDSPKALAAVTRLALDRLECGNFDGFETAVDEALDLASHARHPRHRWRTLLLGSMRALMRGDVAESERFVVEVQSLGALTDDPALTLSLNAHLGQAARLMHRDDEEARLDLLERLGASVPIVAEITAMLRAARFSWIGDAESTQRELAKVRKDSPRMEAIFFAAMLAEAASFVRNRAMCERLRATFQRNVGVAIVSGHVAMTYEGQCARVLGLLDAALDDLVAGESRIREALAVADARGHRSWSAQCRYDLALLLERAGRGAEAKAELARAAELAEGVGMPGLVRRARTRLGVAPAMVALARAPFVMSREGGGWKLEYAGRVARVKDSRGMRMLSRLVELAGEEIHVLALASDDASASLNDEPAGDVLDARARREYKERLDDLEDALADAEHNADAGRVRALRHEREMLATEIARATGFGGAARKTSSASERARVNVQRRLKDALTKVASEDAEIARFLEKAVRTGTYCRFFA